MPTKILAAERQVTRLGEGVFHDGRSRPMPCSSSATTYRAWRRLTRNWTVIGVRAVATSAVRDANNQHEFLEGAAKALGTPVEIISGAEEARLIHLGVHARWPQPGKTRPDGGRGRWQRRTDLVRDGVLAEAFSKPLGAVRLTEVFLQIDPPGPMDLHRMNESIDEKLVAPLRGSDGSVRSRDRHFGHGGGHCLRGQSGDDARTGRTQIV